MPKSTVFLSDQSPVLIDPQRIDKLKQVAADDPLKRARICLHRSHDDLVQQMLIAVDKDSYIRPHRQLEKEKSYIVIEGGMSVVFFDDSGKVTRKIEMSDSSNGKVSMCRFNSSIWHMLQIHSNVVLYLESIEGPFRKRNTEYAPWSPNENEVVGIETLLKRIDSFKNAYGID